MEFCMNRSWVKTSPVYSMSQKRCMKVIVNYMFNVYGGFVTITLI